jgi:hypothetical protein
MDPAVKPEKTERGDPAVKPEKTERGDPAVKPETTEGGCQSSLSPPYRHHLRRQVIQTSYYLKKFVLSILIKRRFFVCLCL